MDDATLLEDLTPAQQQAVKHTDGPLLIIAGAGSGKTRVITRRVAYLIHQGVEPSAILAITFTNKASGEMKQRIGAALERGIRDFGQLHQSWPMICTFHSLCLRILKHYAPLIGLPPNFSIYDSADQTRLLKEAIKLVDLSTTNFPPASVHGVISRAKNKLVTAQDFAQSAGDFYNKSVARIFLKYQALLDQNQALDFDDLLLRTTSAFRSHPEMLAELQERFTHLLIDEYQDTNHAQYILAHALAMKRRNICVVGDPDQSVYAWRGADIQNILDFEHDYPDATVVRLEQNYRSTKTILHIASTLIANNLQRKDKALWTENATGERAKLIRASDEHAEAESVVKEFTRLHDDGLEWKHMAIFYRMNALSRVMERALFNAKIPYQIARGVEFYGRKEIKDVLAYLRVISNPADELSLDRIINAPPRGIGDSTVKLVQTYAVAHGLPLFEALREVEKVIGLSARAVKGVKAFVALVLDWRARAAAGALRPLMEDVVKRSGIEAALRKEGGDELQELANVNELITAAAEYDEQYPQGTLGDYLAQVSLVSDADHLEGSGGAVTLMTLHAAKGLEFPAVAMIGMEEGCLPHARARDDMKQLEEERRLCFVGITRAQQHLILTNAAIRTVRGMRERTMASQFLRQLPQDALEVIDRSREGSSPSYDSQSPGGTMFRRGQLVRHPKFGVGRIADVSETNPQTRAEVDFTSVGRKTLLLEYAQLESVG